MDLLGLRHQREPRQRVCVLAADEGTDAAGVLGPGDVEAGAVAG